MKRNLALWFLLVFINFSCAKEYVFKPLPDSPINHHLVVLAKNKNGVRARGLAGATPAQTTIACQIQHAVKQTISGADGSFSLEVFDIDPDEKSGTLSFTHAGITTKHVYTIKNLPDALKNMVQSPFATDKEIDALEFIGEHAYMLSSQGALVRKFSPDAYFRLPASADAALLLNYDNQISVGARTIKAMGNYIVTPLFNTHNIAIVDAPKLTLLDQNGLQDAQGKSPIFTIDPPLVTKKPIDADGQGLSTTIGKTTPRNPETVVAIDDKHFLVSFTNYYQLADPNSQTGAVVGPGIIGLMSLENGKLKTLKTLVLPFKNPTQLIKKDDTTVWVLCSGAWNYQGNKFESQDSGVVRITIAPDRTAISIAHTLSLGDFSVAEAAIMNNKLIIPRSWGNEILVIDEAATAIRDEDKKSPSFHRPFNFTFAAAWHDNIVFLGDNQGSLIAYSLTEGFFPFPFVEPIIFYKNANPKLALGPLKLYFRHQVEKYDLIKTHKPGFDAWVSTTVHKLLPIDMLAVFGP